MANNANYVKLFLLAGAVGALLASSCFVRTVAARPTPHGGLGGTLPLPSQAAGGRGLKQVSCFPSTGGGSFAFTSASLKAIKAAAHPLEDLELTFFASVGDQQLKQLRWREPEKAQSVFGKRRQALAGGLEGALEVVSFPYDVGLGLGAAAASVAARHPFHISTLMHHVGHGDTDLVSVTLKFKTADKGFIPLTLNLNNNVPINITTGAIVGQYTSHNSIWFTLLTKYAVKMQEATLTGPANVLQAIMGRNTHTFSLTRDGDPGQSGSVGCNGTLLGMQQVLPSETFGAKINRLARKNVGVFDFHDGTTLPAMAGYNAKTGRVEFADHSLQSALNGEAIRIKSHDGKTDVVVGNNNAAYFAVLDVLRSSNGKPNAIRFYNPLGFNFDPKAAVDPTPNGPNREPTGFQRVRPDFVVPISWLKGVASSVTM